MFVCTVGKRLPSSTLNHINHSNSFIPNRKLSLNIFKNEKKSNDEESTSNSGRKQFSFQESSAKISGKGQGLIIVGGVVALSAFFGLTAAGDDKKDNFPSESETSPQQPSSASENKTMSYKYVIIGAGTAGFSALQEIQSRDKDASILLIGNEQHPPYMRPPLSKELWKSDDPEVTKNLKFKDFNGNEQNVWLESDNPPSANTTYKLGSSVTDIDVVKKKLLLDDKTMVIYDKCLIATGGNPKYIPGVPDEIKDKVTTYRTLDDFMELSKIAKKSKNIVVIGGGFLGSELACSLAQKAKSTKSELKITQVFPEAGLMGLVFPKYLSDYTTERISKELSIDIQPGKVITKIEKGKGDKVLLTLHNGKKIEADHVVVSIGISPASQLAKQGDLEIDQQNGGICVNSELQARSDIFVAGDVASYYDVTLGRRRVEHHDHAMTSGKIAAQNMTGATIRYTHQPFFWSDLGSIGYEAVGILDPRNRTVGVWDKTQSTNANKPEFKKGIVYYLNKDDRVVGVLLWNCFEMVEDARRVIMKKKQYKEANDMKNLISLEEEPHAE